MSTAAWPKVSPRDWSLVLVLALWFAVAASILAVSSTGLPHGTLRTAINGLAPAAFNLLCASLAWMASRHPGQNRLRRTAWSLFALASAVEVLATALFTIPQMGGPPSAELLAHYGYMTFSVLTAIGALAMLMDALSPGGDRGGFVVDVFAVLTVVVVLIPEQIVPSLTAGFGSPQLGDLASSLYMAGSAVATIALLTAVLRVPDARREPALHLLAVAWLYQFALDLIWTAQEQSGTYVAGGWLDAAYFVSYAIAGTAAWAELHVAPRPTKERRDQRPASALIPVLGLVVTVLLIVERVGLGRGHFELSTLLLFGGVATLALARQVQIRDHVARLNDELTQSLVDRRLMRLLGRSHDLTVACAVDGRIEYASPAARQILLQEPETLLGHTLAQHVHPDDRTTLLEYLTLLATQPTVAEAREMRLTRSDGSERCIEVVGSNCLDDPEMCCLVLNVRDVTERRAMQAELEKLAYTDPLTALPNRALFLERVSLELMRSDGSPSAVLFMDLDNFKTINDSLGHQAGDAVLRTTAHRLQEQIRTSDTVCRLGGDEFAVLLTQLGADRDALVVGRAILESITRPFDIGGIKVTTSGSVGIAALEVGMNANDVLRNADLAMYQAKASGKNRVAAFSPRLLETAQRRLMMEAEIEQALDEGQFQLHYQPIVDLRSRKLIGIEALARWNHPLRGRVPPAQFIPIAEETGQIVRLGRWALAQACNDLRVWQILAGGELPLRVTVNVSGSHLMRADLADDVRRALAASQLNPQALIIELTETVFMQDSREFHDRLRALKAMGVRFAIDDFGTGYSSLAYLDRLPIDIIKIDRSFVQRLGNDPQSVELARAIVSMADALGLETVAEGVEYEEQCERLLGLGVPSAQGYLFGRPAPLASIVAPLLGKGPRAVRGTTVFA